MTRLSERLLDSNLFTRRKATEDTKRKITDWDIWECTDPTYSYEYDRTVSLYVHDGAAVVKFNDGESVDLQAGDFLTIEKGASALWEIPCSIRNSYVYHDSHESEACRVDQVRPSDMTN